MARNDRKIGSFGTRCLDHTHRQTRSCHITVILRPSGLPHQNRLRYWNEKISIQRENCRGVGEGVRLLQPSDSELTLSYLYTVSQKTRQLCMYGLKDEKLTKSKPAQKLKHANSISEYFEYFCQMSSKSILIILSYTVSNLARY